MKVGIEPEALHVISNGLQRARDYFKLKDELARVEVGFMEGESAISLDVQEAHIQLQAIMADIRSEQTKAKLASQAVTA